MPRKRPKPVSVGAKPRSSLEEPLSKQVQDDSGRAGRSSRRKVALYWVSILVALGVLIGLVVFLSSDANPFRDDERGGVPEDAGKKTAAGTEEYGSLVEAYGKDAVSVQALKIELAHDIGFIRQLDPGFRDDPGCIIVARAGSVGYVFQEEKSLNVVYTPTLEEFQGKTADADPAVRELFWSSLR